MTGTQDKNPSGTRKNHKVRLIHQMPQQTKPHFHKGTEISLKRMQGQNPLINSIANNKWQNARHLIEEDRKLVKRWSLASCLSGGVKASDILPIHQACKMSEIPIQFLEDLISAYPESITKRESGFRRIPLHVAIRANLPEEVIIFLLMKYPEGATIQDILGRVPLHYAICNNMSVGFIKLLIKAYPSAVYVADNMGGLTPLHVAASTSVSREVVEVLTGCGVETVAARTSRGSTPSMCAKISEGPFHDSIVELLHEDEEKIKRIGNPEEKVQNNQDLIQRYCKEKIAGANPAYMSSSVRLGAH